MKKLIEQLNQPMDWWDIIGLMFKLAFVLPWAIIAVLVYVITRLV